ncbi:MAG: type II secretion system F family protein [Verrucomicrobia bacterium]|nr:MAG: type II secretion system F family protein [Verrucomicrobiota bacterium]
MALFHYRAYNAAGETISGFLEADSVSTLEARLRAAGNWLLDAEASSRAVTDTAEKNRRARARRHEVITFFLQMSLLLRAGVTLPHALARLREDLAGSRFEPVVAELCRKVEVGQPLHEAMALFPKIFAPQVTAMIRAGEVSGNLPEVFQGLSDYYEWLDNLNAEVRQSTIYPATVIIVATAFVLLLFTFVVPRFAGLLTEMDLEVPALTRGVMAISHALLEHWPVLIGGGIGVPLAIRFGRRVPRFAIAWDRFMMSIPVFGPLLSMFAITRFAQNLGMLYRSGITLPRALEITRDLVGNRAVEAAVAEVHANVLIGTPMSRTMAEHDVFPKTLVTMIATGETSGSLDTALASVAAYYNTLIPRRIKTLFAVFNPAIMIVLIAVVGVVALSVILPILELWNMR